MEPRLYVVLIAATWTACWVTITAAAVYRLREAVGS